MAHTGNITGNITRYCKIMYSRYVPRVHLYTFTHVQVYRGPYRHTCTCRGGHVTGTVARGVYTCGSLGAKKGGKREENEQMGFEGLQNEIGVTNRNAESSFREIFIVFYSLLFAQRSVRGASRPFKYTSSIRILNHFYV